MKLASERSLLELRKVLKDPNSTGPDPAYWVFSELDSKDKGNNWANLTIISAGNYSGELPKTYGHYNTTAVDELYHLIEGDGILLLQKGSPEKIEEVYLIKAKPGDEIIIKPEYGHSWSNAGETPLLSFDNWTHGHTPADYSPIESRQGMAYYLIRDGESVRALKNPSYGDLPDPIWLSAQEFANK